MGFKVFAAYGAASRPEATLRTSGYLFLSRGILRRGGEENATHAQLMFDDATDKLGLLLYSEAPENGDASIRELSQERSGVSVNILPLLRYYGFPAAKALGKRILSVAFDEAPVVTIDLKGLRPPPEEKIPL